MTSFGLLWVDALLYMLELVRLDDDAPRWDAIATWARLGVGVGWLSFLWRSHVTGSTGLTTTDGAAVLAVVDVVGLLDGIVVLVISVFAVTVSTSRWMSYTCNKVNTSRSLIGCSTVAFCCPNRTSWVIRCMIRSDGGVWYRLQMLVIPKFETTNGYCRS